MSVRGCNRHEGQFLEDPLGILHMELTRDQIREELYQRSFVAIITLPSLFELEEAR